MKIVGNICVCLAGFLYLVPLQMMLSEAGRRRNEGGAVWGSIFVLAPLWILLTIAFLCVTARGGLDGFQLPRGPQYVLALLSGVALAVVTFFSVMGKVEHPNHLPWAARPFFGWAVYVFPLVAIAFVVIALNATATLAVRIPFAIMSAASLLASVGMLLQWVVYSQQQQAARIEEAVSFDQKRDRDIMERVQSLNPTNDFAELLGFSNRFEKSEIRKLALSKAESHPQFRDALAGVLKTWRADSALVYLDACDVAPADKAFLAEPVRSAIEELTKDAVDSVERTHTFFADQFDWNTRLILSVAEKFLDQKVDYLPAISAYRKALDSQRTRNVQLNARQTLDSWLKKQRAFAKA